MAIFRYQVTAVFEDGSESRPGVSGALISGCTASAEFPVVITRAGHGLSDGDVVYLSGFRQMTELNGRQFVVTNKTTDNFRLAAEDGTSYAAETSGGDVQRAFIAAESDNLNTKPVEALWSDVAGAVEYAVYKEYAGVFAFLKHVTRSIFLDDGAIEPDPSHQPPTQNEVKTALVDNPAAVGYYQQRRLFGGSAEKPNTWQASRIGDQNRYYTAGSYEADGPIEATLQADRLNRIRHFVPGRDLVVLTSDSEWEVSSGQDAFSGATIRQRPQSFIGASYVKPLQAEGTIIFERVNGGAIWELRFSYEADGYTQRELSLFSRHLFKGDKVVDMAHVFSPNHLIFMVMESGACNVLSYYPKQEVLAWSKWETHAGKILSVCAVPNLRTGDDDVYFAVERLMVNSFVPGFYIERLEPRKFDDDAFFLDAGLSTKTSVPVSKVSGLDHLKDYDVAMVVDGKVYQGRVNSSGEVALPVAGRNIHVGVPYTSQVETLPLNRQQNTLTGTRKDINKVYVQVDRTEGGKVTVGGVKNDLRIEGSLLDEPTTGVAEALVDSSWDPQGQVKIEQDIPKPMTILSITPDVNIGDYTRS